MVGVAEAGNRRSRTFWRAKVNDAPNGSPMSSRNLTALGEGPAGPAAPSWARLGMVMKVGG